MPPEPHLLYFTGCADRDFALIQHETKLYAVNIPELTKHLFYQLMLVQFQSCDMMQLRPAPKLFDLIRFVYYFFFNFVPILSQTF